MAETNTVLEGSLKYREGKKWKSRWCVIKKLSPVADRLHISLFKDVKDYNKSAPEKTIISLKEFCGIESGFQLDKEQNVMAIICEKQTVLLAFSSTDSLQQWDNRIQTSLGQGQQFPVYLAQIPKGSKLPLGPACMHIHSQRVALTTSIPPKVLLTWNIAHLRRFGDIGDKFVFEGGSSCGKGMGVHIFISDYAMDINQAYRDSMDIRPVSKRDAIRRRSQSMASRNSQHSDHSGQSSPPRYVESPKAVKRQSEKANVNKTTSVGNDKRPLDFYDFPPPARSRLNCSCPAVCMNNLGKNSHGQDLRKNNQSFSANIPSGNSNRGPRPMDRNSSPENGCENLSMPKNLKRCQNASFIETVNQKLSGIYSDYDIVRTSDYDMLPKSSMSNKLVHQDYDILPRTTNTSFSDYHTPTSNRTVPLSECSNRQMRNNDSDEAVFVNVDLGMVSSKNIQNKMIHSTGVASSLCRNIRNKSHGGNAAKHSNNSFEMVDMHGTDSVSNDTCDNRKNVDHSKPLQFVNLEDFDGKTDNNHHFVSYGYDNLVAPKSCYDNEPGMEKSSASKTWVDALGYTRIAADGNPPRCVTKPNQYTSGGKSQMRKNDNESNKCENCGHSSTFKQTSSKSALGRAPRNSYSRKANFTPLYLDYDVLPSMNHVDYHIPRPSSQSDIQASRKYADYDILPPPVRHSDYDIPPPPVRHSDYDIPPRPVKHSDFDVPPPARNPDYHVPPPTRHPDYDVPPPVSHSDYHVPPPVHSDSRAPLRRSSPKTVPTKQLNSKLTDVCRREADYMLMKIDDQRREEAYIECDFDKSKVEKDAYLEMNLTKGSTHSDYANLSPGKYTSTIERNLSAVNMSSYLAMKPGQSGVMETCGDGDLHNRPGTLQFDGNIHRSNSVKELGTNSHRPVYQQSLSCDVSGNNNKPESGHVDMAQKSSPVMKPFDNLVPHEHHSSLKMNSPRSESPKSDVQEKLQQSGPPCNKAGFFSKLMRRNSKEHKTFNPENLPTPKSDEILKSTSSLPEQLPEQCNTETRSRSCSLPEKPAKVGVQGSVKLAADSDKQKQQVPTSQTESIHNDISVYSNSLNRHRLKHSPMSDIKKESQEEEDSEDVWTRREDATETTPLTKGSIKLGLPPKGRAKNQANLTVKVPLDTVAENQGVASTKSTPLSSIPPSPFSVYSAGSNDSHKSEEVARPKSSISSTLKPRSGKEYQKIDRKKLVESVSGDQNSPLSPAMTPQSPSNASVFTFDTMSCISSPSTRLSKASPDWSTKFDTPKLYMNLELSPPSTPTSPCSIPEHKLNYAEIDLSSPMPGSNNSSKRTLPEKSESTTDYAIIDMVATAIANRTGKEHVQWRETSLQLKERKEAGPAACYHSRDSGKLLIVSKERNSSVGSN